MKIKTRYLYKLKINYSIKYQKQVLENPQTANKTSSKTKAKQTKTDR